MSEIPTHFEVSGKDKQMPCAGCARWIPLGDIRGCELNQYGVLTGGPGSPRGYLETRKNSR